MRFCSVSHGDAPGDAPGGHPEARALTQVTLAETMGLPQGEISKIEHRQDVYLSTLRRFIEAMGGELVLAARFPDGELPIQIGD